MIGKQFDRALHQLIQQIAARPARIIVEHRLVGERLVEQATHEIDVANWVLGGHPVRVEAFVGRGLPALTLTGLPGAAKWMTVQAGEEHEHAMKFFQHLIDRGGKVAMGAIAAPDTEWAGPMAAFKAVLEHEQFVTKSINNLYEVALKEKDYPAQVLLAWFINEQVEEEKNASEIVASMARIEARETAVLQLDHQLSKRGKE